MKKILLAFTFVCSIIAGYGQNIGIAAAKLLVENNNASIGLPKILLDNAIVSSAYYNETAGTQMLYLLQGYKGLPVYNKMLVLAFKDGKVVSKAGAFIGDISRMPTAAATPALDAVRAAKTAFVASNLPAPAVLSPVNKLEDGRKVDFGIVPGVYDKVVAELVWFPTEVKGKTSVKLAWSVLVAPDKTDDYWNIMVDATSNAVIDKTNRTIYERFNPEKANSSPAPLQPIASNLFFNSPLPTAAQQTSPLIAKNVNYLVIPYPFESALYSVPTAVSNPSTLAGGGNATSLGWHNNGVTDYKITRGNNVWASEDRAGVNANSGIAPMSSTGPDSLTFDATPDFTVGPTVSANQLFATTNLFYWNNIMHDLSYRYGFDEAAGNFQNTNLGRGGLGNDYVTALAQSSTDVNNANFLPTPDGQRGRMRMYLFNLSNPFRDGDVDNGIINHEYTHGISTRLTGGPANPGCLSNAEEGGEGWSDYFALMSTTNWATATATDGFTIKRPMGNYVYNQGANGGGIRRYPYSTNMAINPLTYAFVKSSGGEVHDIGEVWCATLWDLTWAFIQTDGINANLFNSGAAGGNTAALKIVVEGMKLQPCSPGFLDARDAILQADQNLYGGAHRCTIIGVFARRGMGLNAKQGSSNSTSDQVVGFSSIEPPVLQLTQNVIQQEEELNIVYTNTVKTGQCAGSNLIDFVVTDTLPANVTYVSGGSYNAATRVVSFAVNQPVNSVQTYSFTVRINNGSYFAPITLYSENVAGGALPATLAASPSSPTWVVSAAKSHSAANSLFAADVNGLSDFSIQTTNAIPLGSTPPLLSFWHDYDTEDGWDGGVVEISTNVDSTWTDLGPYMVKNGYNSSIGAGSTLSGRGAFTGKSNGFVETAIRLAPYANQTAKFRFRAASDDNTVSVGWFIDDILLKTFPIVSMRSSIFNAALIKISTSDTVTQILATTGCKDAAITSQPANTTACVGSTAVFSVAAAGTSLNYQWQVSTDNGLTFTDIPGATLDTLTQSSVTAGMNNNRYRANISNACPSSFTSASSILTVDNATSIITSPADVTTCAGTNVSFSVSASGTSPAYQWQVSTNGGTSFTNMAGQTAGTLDLGSVNASMTNNKYRAVVASCNPAGVNSAVATLVVNAPVAIISGPSATVVCESSNAVFTTTATGSNPAYQWQVSTNGGGTFNDITGATSSTLTLNTVSTNLSGNQYRAIVSGPCSSAGIITPAAALTVNTAINISSQPLPSALCAGLNTSFSIGASGSSLAYQWQVSTNGGSGWMNISGQTSSQLNLTAVTTSMNGYFYRAVLNGPCTANLNSTAALLTVNMPVTLVSQPVDASVCVGSASRFAVSALGSTIAYQWQVSINGGAFTNLANNSTYAGVNLNQLDITNASTIINGNFYRVVASGIPCGAITSGSAKLTVNNLPSVIASIGSYPRITPYVSTTLSAVASPAGIYTYQWFRNGNSVANINSPFLPINVDGLGDYNVAVTDANGCRSFSNMLTIRDSASNLLFIYPNPNKGQFDVRYYNADGGSVTRTILVFDARGNKVYAKEFAIAGPYGRMQVSFGAVSGTYLVEVRDQAGKRLATGKIVVIK